MATLNATKARQNFFDLIEEVDKKSTSLTITLRGNPKVVIMPVDEFEGWMETLEILSNKKLVKDLEEAQKEIARGDWISLDELKRKYV